MKKTVAGCLLNAVVMLGLSSCASMPPAVPVPPSIEKALVGKTKQELLACAAVRPFERKGHMKSILVFYKEASLLDESFAGSKSSAPQIHRGCMAHVELQDDRIHHIHYHAVPSTHQEYRYCDEIFESCLGH